MIRRLLKNLGVYEGDAPAATLQLEQDGWAVLPGVFDGRDVAALREEIDVVFDTVPPERTARTRSSSGTSCAIAARRVRRRWATRASSR